MDILSQHGIGSAPPVAKGIVLTAGASEVIITKGLYNGTLASGKISAVVVDASKVLVGTTIAGTAGTMVNRSASALVYTVTTADQAIAVGYTDGAVGSIKVKGEASLLTANIKAGVTIAGVVGKASVVETSTATAIAGNILATKTGFVNGVLITGTMVNRSASALVYTVTTADQAIAVGYTDGAVGSVKVKGEPNLLTANIKAGVTIAGVVGKASVVETSTATAIAGNILATKTGFVNGVLLTGTMPNNASPTATIALEGGAVVIPAGYSPGGSITASITSLVATNILVGATVGGIAGTATADADAVAGNILLAKTAYVNGVKLTGTMPINTSPTATLSTQGATAVISAGYNPGGTITASITNLVAGNITKGIVVGGITGTYTTEATAPITAGTVLLGKKGYINGALVTGTIPTNTVGGTISVQSGTVVVPAGYTAGGTITATMTNLIAGNIKSGATVGGIAGTYDTEASAPITSSAVLAGKVGFVNGAKVIGTATQRNNVEDAISVTPSSRNGYPWLSVQIPFGMYNEASGGIGTYPAIEVEDPDNGFIPENIRMGQTMFGTQGTFTADADALPGNILASRSAYVKGVKINGTMQNNSSPTETLSTQGATAVISAGYSPGGTITANITNLATVNIKSGATVGGLVGTYDKEITAPITAGDVLIGKVGFVNGSKIVGTVPKMYGITYSIDAGLSIEDGAESEFINVQIPKGIYTTAGYNGVYPELEVADPSGNFSDRNNIRAGVAIFGKIGTFTADASAVASNILATKSAYAGGNKIVGTMPDYSRAVSDDTLFYAISAKAVEGYVGLEVPTGYHNQGLRPSGFPRLVHNEPNLKASNIVAGVNILGLIGTAGSTGAYMPIMPEFSGAFSVVSTPTKIKEIKVLASCVMRVDFNFVVDDEGQADYVRVYKNGVAVGITRTVAPFSNTTFMEEFNVSANDLLQLYAWGGSSYLQCGSFILNTRVVATTVIL